jgi:hypothetical protein
MPEVSDSTTKEQEAIEMKVAKHEPTGEYLIVCSQREVDILSSLIGKTKRDTEFTPMWSAIHKYREKIVQLHPEYIPLIKIKDSEDD